MTNNQISQSKIMSANPKNKLGIIAFVLCIIEYVTISYTFGLIAPLTVIISIIALKRKNNSPLPIIALILSIILMVILIMSYPLFLVGIFMKYTPIEGPPNFRSQYLYRFVATEGKFWLDYDKGSLSRIYYFHYMGQGSAGGLYFTSDQPHTFQRKDIISLAEKHGWLYEKDTHYTSDFITSHLDEKGYLLTESDDYSMDDMFFASALFRCPVWIKSECTIIKLHKDDTDGIPIRTYIVLTTTGDQLAIYCDQGT